MDDAIEQARRRIEDSVRALRETGVKVNGGCAARVLIAIGAFMVTVWHGVALLLMGSVRYRGFWDAAIAYTLIGGIPVAAIVSLIVG